MKKDKETKSIKGKAKDIMSQAMMAKYQNKLGEALLLLGILAEMLQEIEEDWADLLYAEMIHQRGVVLEMDKNWAGAYENLLDAAHMRKRLKDYVGLAYTMFQIGMLKLEQTGNDEAAMPSFLKARPYVRRAIDIAEEIGDKKALGNMKHNDAFIDQTMKVYQNAITGYCNALTSRIEAGDKRGEALTKARMAECYLAIDDIYNSGLLANAALQHFRETNDIKRIEQVWKTKKAIVAKKVEQLTKELNELYAKATTKEDYRKAAEITLTIAEFLNDNEEIISKTIKGWWARYYELLKFVKDSAEKKLFVERIEFWYGKITNPEIKVNFGYLYATALSSLADNTEKAEKINQEIKILAEKTGNTSLILQTINSRGIKEMAAKNWEEAVKIFSELDPFYTETLKEQENLLPTANIFNNRGASLIRGGIDPVSGATYLLYAAGFYSRQELPPAKHFKGLPDRLKEAIDKLQSVTGIPNCKEILALIIEARNLLLPVSDTIQQAQPQKEYFDNLLRSIEKIHEKITELSIKNILTF